MLYLNRDRTMTQMLLSLWSYSTRRVEALPKVRVWEPVERVQIVPMPEIHGAYRLTVPHYLSEFI